ncbi:MAG: GIY-YIG nuclease family protein [Candidatus Gastranaerophilaceae bacterium]
MPQSFIYILTNKYNNVFYVGVTSNLIKRIFEHKNKFLDGFTKKYEINKLVYYEIFEDITHAITREKQLKKWKREWKVSLIEKINPKFNDLSSSIY